MMLPSFTTAKPTKPLTVAGRATGTETVLVVDDSAMIRRIAKKILEELNFKTGEAEDGQKIVCESQTAVYWPRDGVQCNPWDQWVQWALDAEYNVVVMPLDPAIRAKRCASCHGDHGGTTSYRACIHRRSCLWRRTERRHPMGRRQGIG